MFSCSHCGAQELRWSGRCTECQKWGTLTEENDAPAGAKKAVSVKAAKVMEFGAVESGAVRRWSLGVDEFDRVLSGGLVPGQVVLLSGEPGVGKSTLLASVARERVMYITGEESPSQLKLRFERMKKKTDGILLVTETTVEAVVATIQKEKPALVIVDSIQTMVTISHDAEAGAPTHLRASTAQLAAVAKETGVPMILVGQITKDGAIAGPKLLEHMVDTVLTFFGDPRHAYRLLRATKNRFGSTDEVGVFEMTEAGLVCVPSPSASFLGAHPHTPGTSVTCVIEGARAFLLEIQALVNPSSYGTPVRRASGLSTNRLQMLLAILERHGKVSFAGQDVYVNVVGGFTTKEPAVDLALAAALLSSRLDATLPEHTIYVGEVGLGGEVRPAPFLDRRSKEATRLGFDRTVASKEVSTIPALVSQIGGRRIHAPDTFVEKQIVGT